MAAAEAHSSGRSDGGHVDSGSLKGRKGGEVRRGGRGLMLSQRESEGGEERWGRGPTWCISGKLACVSQ